MLTDWNTMLTQFKEHLQALGCSKATIQKYLHDVGVLEEYVGGDLNDKSQLNGYKDYLEGKKYTGISINSMLAAANKFLDFVGIDYRFTYMKVQKRAFIPPDRELTRQEYERMVKQAVKMGDVRLATLLQTIAALGIRVSEVKAITVECLEQGEATIKNKGKIRIILIPTELAQKLKGYCNEKGIKTGPVFVTRTGKPMDRSNIWRMMQKLAKAAEVASTKAFPHSFRHFFARTYYGKFHDIVRLADILGHSSIDTTRIYTAHSSSEQRKQLGQLGLVI